MELVSNITPIEPNKVCPFRTFTKNVQISQAEMHQIVFFPECYYSKCFYFKKGECELVKVKLAGY